MGMKIFLNLASLERRLKAINAFAESCDALPPDPTAVKQAIDECTAAEVEIAPWFHARRRGVRPHPPFQEVYDGTPWTVR
eukprot:1747828-Pyramimonas_sp.AAC.1